MNFERTQPYKSAPFLLFQLSITDFKLKINDQQKKILLVIILNDNPYLSKIIFRTSFKPLDSNR